MKRALAILGACGAAGCGGSVISAAETPSDHTVPRVSVVEGRSTQVAGIETIAAEAELLGLKAGTLEWTSSGACPAKGRALGTARAALQTAGVIRWFKQSDGTAATVLDPKSSYPLEQEMRVSDGGEQRRYQLKFSPGKFHYVYEREGQSAQSATKPVPLGDRAYDVQSAFLLLRAWRPELKERGYFHVVLGRTLWRSEVVFMGQQMLELEDDKKVVALRIDGVARKVKTDPDDDTPSRNFVLWFAPDERRTPLRVVADGKYGALLLTMTSHKVAPDGDCAVQPKTVTAKAPAPKTAAPPAPVASGTTGSAPQHEPAAVSQDTAPSQDPGPPAEPAVLP